MAVVIVAIWALQTISIPGLVGLWDFAAISGEPGASAVRVDVHGSPSASAAVVAHLDMEGISPDRSTRSCEWIRDLDIPTAPRGCIYTESDYEVPSVAVFEQRGDWLRIALDNEATRFGWIQQRDQFHALADLLASDRRLTYLTTAWNRVLYDSAGSGAPASRGGNTRAPRKGAGEVPYRAVGQAFVQGRLWLHVEILDEVCGDHEPRVIDTGWVPAQSPTGVQWAWFWSRGC